MTPTHDLGRICLEDLAPMKEVLRNTPAQQDAHKEMVASIRAHGMLHALVVRKEEECYRVIGGHRRFAALKELAAAGDIKADSMVPCTIEEGLDDTEVALAENTVRVAMHPADQAVAFAQLAEQGASEDDIGVRFGLSARTVQRRLRLGRLAPEILEAYRQGEIETEIAHAYACTANTERQLTVFKAVNHADNSYYSSTPRIVLERLEADHLRSDSPLAKFVGAKKYHAEGGQSEATLFADYSVFSDIDLLNRLAVEKFERIAARLEKEGWKWVEYIVDSSPWEVIHKCTKLYHQPATPTAAEEAILDAAKAWDKEHDGISYDELHPELQAECDKLQEQHDNVQQALRDRRIWTDEQKAGSGVVLFLGNGGKTGKEEGLVNPGDPVPGRDDTSSNGADTGAGGSVTGRADAPEQPQPKGYSQGLRESMTELRNAVLRAAVRENPEIANDLLVFNLALSLKTSRWGDDVSTIFHPTLPLGTREESPSRLGVPGASEAMNGYINDPKWSPDWIGPKKSVGEMFEAYRALSAEEKGQIASIVASRLLLCEPGGEDTKYDAHDAIDKELGLSFAPRLLDVDPEVWSVETYWGRLRKDQIIEEAGPYLGDDWKVEAAKMKKGELAADAAKRMKQFPEWLPKGFERGT